MKKIILLFLLITGTVQTLPAQLRDLPNRSQSIFDNPAPGKSNAIFTFYLSSSIRVVLECQYISQIEQLPDLDSFVKAATTMLDPLSDSLKVDGIVRRADIVLTDAIPKIRIISHPEFTNTYTIKDQELMQLKINQDTLRIIGLSKSRATRYTIDANGKKSITPRISQFTLMIIVNNFSDVATIAPDAIKKCVISLQQKVEKFYSRDKLNSPDYTYMGNFFTRSGEMFSPVKDSYIPTGYERSSPLLGFSLTAVRGSITPSIQAGMAFNSGNNYLNNSFKVYIERQYFFSRDLTNKLTTDPNLFAVFQFTQTNKTRGPNNLSFAGNLSIGYLISRKGNWYEPSTFRIGLPVLKTRHISIEPQLVFNGWFKNVSPSLKFSFTF